MEEASIRKLYPLSKPLLFSFRFRKRRGSPFFFKPFVELPDFSVVFVNSDGQFCLCRFPTVAMNSYLVMNEGKLVLVFLRAVRLWAF